MGQFRGITTKTMKDGNKAIMVRFKHLGITYSIKNFTKLFGCRTEKSAYEKLNEIKLSISKGQNPFTTTAIILDDLFNERCEIMLKNNEWTESTYKSYRNYYDTHIKKELGFKKMEKITYEDVMKILNKFKIEQSALKNKLSSILQPLFREEVKKGNIFKNIFDDIDKFKENGKEDISKRVINMKPIDIMRELLDAIDKFDYSLVKNSEKIRMFFYFTLMTAHRWGEVLKIEKKHCYMDDKKVITTKDITKTKIVSEFPIPDECIDYINRIEEGRIFDIPLSGDMYTKFQYLVGKTNIKLFEDKKISIHDSRKMMLSIMINDLNIDSRLADFCLDHQQQGTIKHYLEFSYEDKKRAYNKYWDYLRGINQKDKKVAEKVSNNGHFEELKELADMFRDGLLSKNEFEIMKRKLF